MVNVPPMVTVIVPCRNEVGYVPTLVRALARQQWPDGGLEFIIADGMSDDGTREWLTEHAPALARVRVIDNPGRIVSTALNRGVEAARGEIIVRMDAHTEYAEDYVRSCVRVLQETGADNVGGPWRAAGSGYLQGAIALGFRSRFASGGAASRALNYDGPVDTVYLGCWRRKTLLALGGFDEELIRNQDDELNLRITKTGGRVWQSSSIRSTYHPRSSLRVLFTQYAQYGYWKVRVIQKHRLPASIRHVVPGVFVATMLVLTPLAFVTPALGWTWFGAVGAYAAASVAATVRLCHPAGRRRFAPIMPFIFAAYQFGYGYGFLRGVIDFLVLRRHGSPQFQTLTRESSRP